MSPPGKPADNRGNRTIRPLLEFLVILAVAFALVFGFVRPVVAAPFKIPSGSMEPTLHGCEAATTTGFWQTN